MEAVLTFLALSVPIMMSPGPVAIALVGIGMHRGVAGGLPFIAGVLLSALVVSVAAGLGLLGVILTNAYVYRVIRYAGLAYIVYLGVKFMLARPKALGSTGGGSRLHDGLLLMAFNPKFYLAVSVLFSQFLHRGQNVLLALVPGLLAVAVTSCLMWLGAGAGLGLVIRSERALRIQSIAFGLLLIGVAVHLALKGA